jgi:hypothetical protein
MEPEEAQTRRLLGLPIVIDTTALVFWDRDHARTQRTFLDRIDPSYFRYLARLHESQLDGDDRLNAGVALRITYSHALESLFALIGAAVQAPRTPAGWILKYQYRELRNLVTKISNGQDYDNRLNLERARWPAVARALAPWNTPDAELDEHREATGHLWKALAQKLLDGDFDNEYMSLKHGFRVGSGQWYFRIGAEDVPGVPAPPERMRTLAASDFGSSFYRARKLKPHHWSLEEPRVNWNPRVFATTLPLIADNMENVLTFLKVINGDVSDELGLHLMTRERVDEALHDPDLRSSSFRFNTRSHIDPQVIPDTSADDVLRAYRGGADSSTAAKQEE